MKSPGITTLHSLAIGYCTNHYKSECSFIEWKVFCHLFAFPALFDVRIEPVEVVSGDTPGRVKGDIFIGGLGVIKEFLGHADREHQGGPFDFRIFDLEVLQYPDGGRGKGHGDGKMFKLAPVEPLVLHENLGR